MGLLDLLRGRSPEDAFAHRAIERLKARGWSAPLSYDRASFSLRLGVDRQQAFLGNVYEDWRRYPRGEQDAALDQAIAFILDDQQELTFDRACERLLPVVRNRTLLALQAGADAYVRSVRPLAGPLGVLAAVDSPASLRIVNDATLADWGRTLDEVLEVAIANLRATSSCRFERMPAGFHVSDFDDQYDASRLLLPELFAQLDLRGEPVAVAISRPCLVVAGSEEVEALCAMAAFVREQAPQESRPIAYTPLILSGGEWSEFRPEAAALAPVLDLHREQQSADDADQRAALDRER